MASDILHIKDSYYFEVPKFLWRVKHDHAEDFPGWWVRLDEDYQKWEAEQICHDLEKIVPKGKLPETSELVEAYEHWKHEDHINFAKPFANYLEEGAATIEGEFKKWQAEEGNAERSFDEFLTTTGKSDDAWFALVLRDENRSETWAKIKEYEIRVDQYVKSDKANWSEAKIAAYNQNLSGKVLIPQPFGKVRNLYQADSGFCVSKFMVLELIVAGIMVCTFGWLSRKLRKGDAPKGKVANMLEAILLFLRNEVARPAIGGKEADRFVPLLWTIFLFILGCNLFGLIPWMGTPTGAFSVTIPLAAMTLLTGIFCGSRKFGPVGFWLNQIPSMDLPGPVGLIIKPVIFVIEVVGLFVKHAVLAIRLLVNMVAGHLVLLGILALAFSIQGATSPYWSLTAVLCTIGASVFSCLELFVAFLQAYVFTLLSALFIGAAIHHH